MQHIAHQLWVESRSGLVKQHDARLCGQGARNGNPLLLPARKLGRVAVAFLGQAHALKTLQTFFFCCGAAFARYRNERLGDIFHHGHVRPQVEMLKHHAKVAPAFAYAGFAGAAAGSIILHLVAHQRALDQNFALVVHFKKIHAAQQGAFARAGWPN